MTNDTTRRTALVTGASTGIGEQFTRLLAARGNDLVIVARDRAKLDALAKELHDAHGTACEVLAADLTDVDQLAAVEHRIAHGMPEIDVLVNNAGFGSSGRFDELDVAGEEAQVRLNIIALQRLTHAAVRAMVPRGRGGILNVSSIASFQPAPYNATYSATKAFVTSFTEAVHEELKGTGVAISALCPGYTHSEFHGRAGIEKNAIPGIAWQSPELVARVGLEGLAKNKAIVVPGTANRVVAVVTKMTPHAVTRRVAGVVMKRTI